jgi:hypothetical protein
MELCVLSKLPAHLIRIFEIKPCQPWSNLSCRQVRDNLGVLQSRWEALKLPAHPPSPYTSHSQAPTAPHLPNSTAGGGGLHLSRESGSASRPLGVKSVVMYSPNWVKNQNRMSGNSNQETFKAEMSGRVVFDVLRQVGML